MVSLDSFMASADLPAMCEKTRASFSFSLAKVAVSEDSAFCASPADLKLAGRTRDHIFFAVAS